MELGDTSNLDAEGRNKLFARGLSLEKGGKKELALKCYLGCLSGLSKDTRFVLLPQCLRNVRIENGTRGNDAHFVNSILCNRLSSLFLFSGALFFAHHIIYKTMFIIPMNSLKGIFFLNCF